MKNKLLITGAILILALLGMCYYQHGKIVKFRTDSERNRANVEVLMGEVQRYKTSDSLNAASVSALQISLSDYKRWRAEDLATIKSLQSRNKDLASVVKDQSEQIYHLKSAVHDTTVIVRDSIVIPAQAVRCGDDWYDFGGILAEGEFSGTMSTRDDILVAEFITYKRFLGFLWKTKKIKDRKIEVVSRNPHSKITDVEFVKFTDKND